MRNASLNHRFKPQAYFSTPLQAEHGGTYGGTYDSILRNSQNQDRWKLANRMA